MRTLAEIEKAIEALSPEQRIELRRWMEVHAPKIRRAPGESVPMDFDKWLAASIGIAKGR